MNAEQNPASPAPEAKKIEATPPPKTPTPPPTATVRKSGWVRAVIGVILVAVALGFGVPWVIHSLNTVSTDDAYVNSYVTFVAPRVSGQVARVLVDDNNRVKKGDVLVELDPEPYQVQVNIEQAAVDSAQADLLAAEANVRAQVNQIRSARFS